MASALTRDPYKNYRFKVFFDSSSDPVAGVTNVSAISKSTEAIDFRSGDDDPGPISTPGITSFEPVTLSKGLTSSGVFHDWANKLHLTNGYDYDGIRKDVTVALCGDNGEIKVKYTLKECWVSSYQALPDLASDANDIAIQTITMQHEGFERIDV